MVFSLQHQNVTKREPHRTTAKNRTAGLGASLLPSPAPGEAMGTDGAAQHRIGAIPVPPTSKAVLGWTQFRRTNCASAGTADGKASSAKSAGSAAAQFCQYKDGYRGILLAQQSYPERGGYCFFLMLLPSPAVWKTSPWAQQATVSNPP